MATLYYGTQEIRTDDATARAVMDHLETCCAEGRTELVKIGAPPHSGQGDTLFTVGAGIPILVRLG